jgi:hypothetical protein
MHLYTLQMKLQILDLAACSSVVFAFVCPRDYCETVDCTKVTKLPCPPNEILVANASSCGCCPICTWFQNMIMIIIIFSFI